MQFALTAGERESYYLMEIDRFFCLVNHELLAAFKQRLKHAAFNFQEDLNGGDGQDFKSLVLTNIPHRKQGGILFVPLSFVGGLTLKDFLLFEAIFVENQPYVRHVVQYEWAALPENFGELRGTVRVTEDASIASQVKLRKLIKESDMFVHKLSYWAVSCECEP